LRRGNRRTDGGPCRLDAVEGLAIEGEGVEADGEEAVPRGVRYHHAQWLPIDLYGDGLAIGRLVDEWVLHGFAPSALQKSRRLHRRSGDRSNDGITCRLIRCCDEVTFVWVGNTSE